MRCFVLVLMLAVAAAATAVSISAQDMPLWAYGYSAPPPPPGAPPVARPAAVPERAPAPEVARTLPGAAGSFTRSQIFNRFGPADWYPDSHPLMPAVVAKGRESGNVWACML